MVNPKIKIQFLLRDLVFIVMGSIFLGLGLVLFLIPNKIVIGGVAGISIVLHYLIRTPTGLTMLIINLPLLLTGLKYQGKTFLFRTLIAMVLVSFFTDLFSINLHFPPLTHNLMLATLYGGLLIGVGLGFIFKGDASAGGGTILAKVISQKSRFKTGQVLFVLDLVVISFAAVAFKNVELALWGFITIFISSQLLDLILTGKPFAKTAYILTEQANTIGKHLFQELGRSATVIPAQSFDNRSAREIMLVVVDPGQILRLRDIVSAADPSAFIIIMDTREIYGKGF